MEMKVTSIILAGGKNLRLGRNKALEVVGGKRLIERVVERLKPLSNRILIVTSEGQVDFPPTCNAEVMVDLYPGKGPLGGIYTGLLASQSSYSIAVACDMPFLNTELLRYMVERASDSDVVIPRLDEGMVESLHAVYSRGCLVSIRTQLELNQLGVHSLLSKVRVKYIEREECQKLDPQLLSFFNINCQADLDRANALARENEIV
ncbi:MAG: molybdenum cofactor guanylyltransferase [Chloroflexota bacterium]